MFKKLIMWLFFTIIAGLLPLGLKFIVCCLSKTSFSYSGACSEVFFFDLIVSVNGLKELYDIDNNRKVKIALFASLIFLVIGLSVIYGFLLINESMSLNLDLSDVYTYSKWCTIICVLSNLGIQILGGIS